MSWRFVPCDVTVQHHHICFVIGLLMCNSTLRRPLSRICSSSEAALLNRYIPYGMLSGHPEKKEKYTS
jgi:hypothetical protein